MSCTRRGGAKSDHVAIHGAQTHLVDYQNYPDVKNVFDIKNAAGERVQAAACDLEKDVHYTYVKSPFAGSSLLTFQDLGSQFGRQVAFEISKAVKGEAVGRDVSWNWREHACEENMLATMRDMAAPLKALATSPDARKFGYQYSIEPTRAAMVQHGAASSVALSL